MASRTASPASTPAGASPSGSGTSTPAPALDLYRPLANQVKKPLQPFLPPGAAAPSLPALLALDAPAYSSRLSGKNLLLAAGANASAGPSTLVVGKKRNRGDAAERARVRAAHDAARAARAEVGAEGARKVKARFHVPRGAVVDPSVLAPLHEMHRHYMAHLLGLPPAPAAPAAPAPAPAPEPIAAKLVHADLTGARLRVRAARNPALVGLGGVVLEETAGAFRLVGDDGRARVVAKHGALFRLVLPLYAPPSPPATADPPPAAPAPPAALALEPVIALDLLGSAFAFRSADRAGRKFKQPQGLPGSGWGASWVAGAWDGVLGPEPGEGRRDTLASRTPRRPRGKARRKDPLAGGSRGV